MNHLVWMIVAFIGQLLTSTVPISHIYDKQIGEHEVSRRTLSVTPSSEVSLLEQPHRQQRLIKWSDFKDVFNTYSKYVLLDLVFEALKTITVLIVRIYLERPGGFLRVENAKFDYQDPASQ